MENLNNKLEGLRNIVRKIKNEIKNFEEKEHNNSQIRANTVSNKTYRNYSSNMNNTFNKFNFEKNKNLMKTYFQLASKEQNNNQPRSTKDYILNMKACHKINKKINFRNEIKGPKKELKSSQINRDKIKNIKLFEYINERQKKVSRQQKNEQKKIDYFDKIIMTYSNEDNLKNIKNNIINDFNKNKGNKSSFNVRNHNINNENEESKLYNEDSFDKYKNKINHSLNIFNNNKKNMKKYCINNNIYNFNKYAQNFIDNSSNNLIEKNKLNEIIGNETIEDIYTKAKIFEKYGKDIYQNFINNHNSYCNSNSNNNINNLKAFKNFILKINQEDIKFQKKINFYQQFCKNIFRQIEDKQKEEIINKIRNKYNIDKEKGNYIMEEINMIISDNKNI